MPLLWTSPTKFSSLRNSKRLLLGLVHNTIVNRYINTLNMSMLKVSISMIDFDSVQSIVITSIHANLDRYYSDYRYRDLISGSLAFVNARIRGPKYGASLPNPVGSTLQKFEETEVEKRLVIVQRRIHVFLSNGQKVTFQTGHRLRLGQTVHDLRAYIREQLRGGSGIQ